MINDSPQKTNLWESPTQWPVLSMKTTCRLFSPDDLNVLCYYLNCSRVGNQIFHDSPHCYMEETMVHCGTKKQKNPRRDENFSLLKIGNNLSFLPGPTPLACTQNYVQNNLPHRVKLHSFINKKLIDLNSKQLSFGILDRR
jgi:hypothetical protein